MDDTADENPISSSVSVTCQDTLADTLKAINYLVEQINAQYPLASALRYTIPEVCNAAYEIPVEGNPEDVLNNKEIV